LGLDSVLHKKTVRRKRHLDDQREARVYSEESNVAGALREKTLPCASVGLYEWKKLDANTKQPYFFTVPDTSLFAFAGLWDAWKDKDGHWLQSSNIVTTEADELMLAVHTRMLCISHPRDYDRWLSREITEQPPIDLLRPYEPEDMEMQPANRLVADVKNNGPQMLVAEIELNSA